MGKLLPMPSEPPHDASAFPSEETTVSDLHVEIRTPEPPRCSVQAQLVVLAGEHVGRRQAVGGQFVLGRGHGADFQIDDAQVSRRHARILRRGDDFYVEDLHSRNGTLLNGRRIEGAKKLVFGDRIQLGARVVLLFCCHDPAEEALQHRQRLEALGRLGAGLAHDFNNLLGALRSTLDYLESIPPDRRLGDRDVGDSLRDMRAAADRAAELVRRVLGFARRRPTEPETLDFSEVVHEVVRLCRRTFPRSLRIYVRAEPRQFVVGDRSQLHQVLMNLCLNARDATGGEGTIRLDVGPPSQRELERTGLGRGAGYVRLLVEDSGSGMDEETLRHAFDPFFTTKPGHVGSGIGLATAYQTVQNHGGSMAIESAPGEGTRVWVLLPLSAHTGAEQRPARRTTERMVVRRPVRNAADAATRHLVLLVDDEEVVRRSTARLLRRAGYDVTFAKDGREALAIVRHAERRPDVVLMDLDMPVMRGEEAFRKMRNLAPELPVVFVSGYWDEARERELKHAGAAGFLYKPFEAEELRLTLAATIE